MSIIPKEYMNSVVAIGRQTGEKIEWFATGFFAGKKVDEEKFSPYLVTNKHVFEGQNQVVIKMKNKSSSEFENVEVDLIDASGNRRYFIHTSPDIDLAVLPLNGKFIESHNYNFYVFALPDNVLTSSDLRANGCEEGNLIYMLGYPMGIVDESSMLPICRMGCIAKMTESYIKETHNIIVDIENFPGNSGSPIITRPDILSVEGSKNLAQTVLCGIVYGYIPYEEKLLNLQTKKIVESRTENSGLALAVPIEYLNEIIEEIETVRGKIDSAS